MRRLLLTGAAATCALAAAAPAFAASVDKQTLKRATSTYAALQKYLYLPKQGLYRGSPYSHVWPFSQALAATISMGSLPKVGIHYGKDVKARIKALNSYWDATKQPPGYDGDVVAPLGNGGTISYDDNEWIGLELVRRYQRSHDAGLLARAQQLFTLVVFGWDNDTTHACPGGIVFSQAPDNVDRNTVSNAPGVELGLRLYEITGTSYYLDWAKRMYDWVNGCLFVNGLFEDHITFDGQIDQTIWSYNQGTTIGSNVLLWKVTGHRGYLARAKAGAAAALAFFTPAKLRRQPPYFVAIFFDNLLILDAVRPDPNYRAAIQSYASWAWRKVRVKKTGIFPFHTDGGQVLEQAAMARIYAALAGAALIG